MANEVDVASISQYVVEAPASPGNVFVSQLSEYIVDAPEKVGRVFVSEVSQYIVEAPLDIIPRRRQSIIVF